MQTLKSNNVKLTAALKESNEHVTEWKDKLQQYKEESAELKRKVACDTVLQSFNVCIDRYWIWRQPAVRE